MAVTAVSRAIRAINADQRGGDGAEFVTHLLATVAANLGSSDAVTAGRPGSWEAAGVSDLLRSTVGYDDEYLLTYRTEPIEIVVNSIYELDDPGMFETYEAGTSHIDQVLFGDRWSPSRDKLPRPLGAGKREGARGGQGRAVGLSGSGISLTRPATPETSPSSFDL